MMKKLLFSVFLLLMVAIGAVAQETLTVCDGTATSSCIPFNGSYVDAQECTCEFVISAETEGMSDMEGGTISSLTFHISGSPDSWGSPTIKVYMGEVVGTTLSSISGPDNFTLVYTGIVSNTTNPLVIELSEPYTYRGGNLFIGTDVETASDIYGNTRFYGVSAASGSSIYYSSNLESAAPQSFLPKTTFSYELPATSCPKPTELAKSNLTARTVDLAWVAGGEETEWQICLNGNEDNLTVATNPYTLENLNPETAYTVKVRANCGSEQSRWSNTVSFTTLPTCPVPTELAYADVTTNSVVLSWTAGGSETAWQICINNNETELVDVIENPYTLTGLDPATTYSIKVRANCGDTDGNSQWTSAVQFSTECDGSAYSVPFVETFDMSSNSVLCWTIIDANEDVNEYHGAWNFDGDQALYWYNSYSAANDWLISPKIAIVDGAYLTFDYAVDNDYYPEKFSVYVMTDIADYATATVIRETATVTNEEFASIDNIDLSAYAGQDIYIGIKCESDANQDVLFIDNFKVILPTYTITATAGENGTIDPESAEVMYGYDKMFTITPDEGYRIATVVVDAETEGEANVTENVVAGDGYYTFTNVTANHTIHATFELIPTHTITVNAGENGNVYYNDALVSDPIVVNEDATPEFEITPATGYQIDVLTVGGNTIELTEQQLGGFTYTFEPVRADITLVVTFEAIPVTTHTITVNAGENGTVTYNDEEVTAPVVVNEGDTPAFVITPAENYQIDVLSVDETPVELTPEQLLEGYTYTFAAVEGDHTLTVTFVPVQSAEMFEAGSMSIYPNPNNGMFSIDFSNIEGDATYQIIDARGAVVETRDINVMNGETMNFNHDLRPGTYFVRIINGDKVYVEQIVVE